MDSQATVVQQAFPGKFDRYVCIGDRLETSIGDIDFQAVILRDEDAHINDDDSHASADVTGADPETDKKIQAAKQAWYNNEWWYCGIVVTASKAGVELTSKSLWSIEANYPESDNNYLTEVANELLNEAIEPAKAALAELIKKLQA